MESNTPDITQITSKIKSTFKDSKYHENVNDINWFEKEKIASKDQAVEKQQIPSLEPDIENQENEIDESMHNEILMCMKCGTNDQIGLYMKR